jgi:PAS domain S-box-containing protein
MKNDKSARSQEIHKSVREEQVMQLYARFPFAAAAALILSTVLLFAQRPVIDFTILFAWWGALVTITILRLLLVFCFRRAADVPTRIETWAARFLTGSFFAGLAWGAAGFLLFPEQGPANQLILIFTLAGLASAAVATLMAEWDNIAVFLCSLLVPVILRFLLFSSSTYLMMALMTLIYLIALLLISRNLHNTVTEFLTLRTTDIRKEAKLLESEAKYRNVVERSNDGIGIIRDGQFVYANEQLARMIGYSAGEMTGKPFAGFVHPDELPLVADRYRRRMAGEDVSSIYETLGKHKDGRKVPMELNVGLIPYQNELAELVIVRDISDRKQAEAALQESENRYRALFSHASDFIFIIDPLVSDDPVIVDVNEYACVKHGYSREELIGKPYSIVDDDKGQDDITDKSLRIMAGEILNFESIHVRKDGHRFPVEVSARLIKTNEKPLLIAIVRDITERKQAEKQIKERLREKEVLLKEIHHRVKNNLQVISSLLSLQSRYSGDKQVGEVFKKNQERIRAMAVAHEKLYRSKYLSKISFREYIGSLTTYLFESYSFVPGQVGLETQIEDIFVNLETAIPLGLIINELVSNSLKHAFPEGKKGILSIRLKKSKSSKFDYILTICDSGVGLPEGIDFQEGGSLGMVLVGTLTKQLQGVIDHKEKNGACFTLKFKKINDQE